MRNTIYKKVTLPIISDYYTEKVKGRKIGSLKTLYLKLFTNVLKKY